MRSFAEEAAMIYQIAAFLAAPEAVWQSVHTHSAHQLSRITLSRSRQPLEPSFPHRAAFEVTEEGRDGGHMVEAVHDLMADFMLGARWG